MTEKTTQDRKRLSAQAWLTSGLEALKDQGFTALKADILAKRIGTTRGSFYWHFANVKDFHQAIIEYWRQVAVEDIINDIEALPETNDRLERLIRGAFGAESTLERQMRAWAIQNEIAAKAVQTVDKRRRAFLTALLTDAGVPAKTATTRADIIYWSYLGASLSDCKPTGARLDALVQELLALAR